MEVTRRYLHLIIVELLCQWQKYYAIKLLTFLKHSGIAEFSTLSHTFVLDPATVTLFLAVESFVVLDITFLEVFLIQISRDGKLR